MLGMQGIVQALITRPQLDPIPFRQRHIQAVIRLEQIPDRLAGFVRREAASPRRPQEGADHLRGEVVRYQHVDHLVLPVSKEGRSRSGVVFRGDFPCDDDTAVDHQAR